MTIHDPIEETVRRYLTESGSEPQGQVQCIQRMDAIALITQTITRLIDDGHLQQPDSDEWQECRFEDIQPGDRVRLVLKNGPLTDSPTIIETEPHVAKAHYLGWTRHQTGSTIEASDVQAVYRIPKKIIHPDPAEHPVIILHRPNGAGTTPVSYAWTGQHYRSFDGQEYFSANEITDWSPAKVVADDDR
jgi:hypothetical protein